jgi:hypothetical protein
LFIVLGDVVVGIIKLKDELCMCEGACGHYFEERSKPTGEGASFICPRYGKIITPEICIQWRKSFGVEACADCLLWTVYVRRAEG